MLAYLLFWAAVVPVAVRSLKRYSAPPAPAGQDDAASPDPAVAVLRMRLSRGEIDVEDFLAREAVLRCRRP